MVSQVVDLPGGSSYYIEYIDLGVILSGDATDQIVTFNTYINGQLLASDTRELYNNTGVPQGQYVFGTLSDVNCFTSPCPKTLNPGDVLYIELTIPTIS